MNMTARALLFARRVVAPLVRAVSPALACFHCGMPMRIGRAHWVEYERYVNGGTSFSITCVDCWPLLTPGEMMRYAAELVDGTGYGWRQTRAWSTRAAGLALTAMRNAAMLRQRGEA